MPTIGNVSAEQTVLRLFARKSFALGIWLQTQNGSPLDITNCTISLVVRKRTPAADMGDVENLISNSVATIMAPTLGFAKFNLQASDLDHAPGDYDMTITLIDDGYSTVLVQGTLSLEQNTEFGSLSTSYTSSAEMATSLKIAIRDQTVLKISTGPTLAPGEAVFTEDMANKLLQLFAGAVGAGTTLTADDIVEGVNHLFMTPAERARLANLTLNWVDIQGKPTFGSIISHSDREFVKVGAGSATDIVSGVLNSARVPRFTELRGVDDGTAAPTSGSDGDIYLRYS